jgi:hypothetical protein
MKKLIATLFVLLAACSPVLEAPVLASAEKLTAADWKSITEQRKLYFIFAERESFSERGAVFSKTANDYVDFMDDEAARAPETRDAGELFLAALMKNDPEAARTLSEAPAGQFAVEEVPSPVVPFSVPIDWIAVESQEQGTEVYQTSFDKANRFFVTIRMVPTSPMTSEEWVRAEVAANAERGIETLGDPVDHDALGKDWVKIEWRDPGTGDRGFRYYLEAPASHLVEVSVFAKEEAFAAGDLTRFDTFLSSFEFNDNE